MDDHQPNEDPEWSFDQPETFVPGQIIGCFDVLFLILKYYENGFVDLMRNDGSFFEQQKLNTDMFPYVHISP